MRIGMLCYVTRYNPATRRPIGDAQVVEPETKQHAAELGIVLRPYPGWARQCHR
jgi:hypothetical protein